jgi:MoaA/NifB/PqqE/SkfB family radical SAM enzyme
VTASGAGPEQILASELGKPFSEYRRRWELAKSFREIPPYPLHVDYELMRACNLRCPMCLFAGGAGKAGGGAAGTRGPGAGPGGASPAREGEGAGAGEGSGGKSLPAGFVKDLLREGAALGQASMGFGGLWEPLLSPDVPALVACGREMGLVDAMMNTNALLLTRSLSKDLIEAGLTRLMVSMDAATGETYARMRPGSDFGNVTENVMGFLAERAAAGSRLPLLRLSFCVTSINEAELGAFLGRWEGKADFFSVQRYGDFGAGKPVFPRDPPGPAPSGRCAQPFKRLMVTHDGTALPCCDLSGLALALGDARGQGSLAGVWKGGRIAALREAILRDEPSGLPEACRKCRGKFAPSA